MREGVPSRELRDHLFLSYATEQAALADWLALKLTAAGYLVWWDRGKLLGGESYPHDIDRAIKERTFRLIAVLSPQAIHKPNPTGERTLALKIGAERNIDFLIPLNATGLSGTELDWMTTNLTYIPFHRGWADGFRQLIAKLESIEAPRPLTDGDSRVVDWYNARAEVPTGSEMLWANVLAIDGVPSEVYRLRTERAWTDRPSEWISHWPDRSTGWCLSLPEAPLPEGVSVDSVHWGTGSPEESTALDVVTALLRKHLDTYVVQRGMRLDDPVAYFPVGLLKDDKLRYTNTSGRLVPIKVTGQRNFKTIGGGTASVRYHLGFASHPDFRTFERWTLHVHPRIVIRDLSDQPLEPRVANRRRRAMCRSWFNHEWGTRFKAVAEWLAPLDAPASLSPHGPTQISLVGTPVTIAAPFKLDEPDGGQPVEDERVVLDERDGFDRSGDDEDA